MTEEKVALGRLLFFDPLLSGNRSLACAGCHEPARAFADGRPRSEGATGESTRRNAPGLANVAYNSSLTWANPGLTRLEDHAMGPLLQTHPLELGLSEAEIGPRLEAEARYRDGFSSAWPDDPEPFTLRRVVEALAAFQRSLLSGGSPYDRFLASDRAALSESALLGLELFFSERFECFHCHGGFNFSEASVHANSSFSATAFHNIGLYNVDGRGAYPERDRGLMEISGQLADMGRFRAPSLRNVAVSAPYMHDGSVATLEAAIDHYARGGRLIEDGPDAGDGRRSFLKSGFVTGFRMLPEEREAMIAFLTSLTDQAFLENPAHADPYR